MDARRARRVPRCSRAKAVRGIRRARSPASSSPHSLQPRLWQFAGARAQYQSRVPAQADALGVALGPQARIHGREREVRVNLKTRTARRTRVVEDEDGRLGFSHQLHGLILKAQQSLCERLILTVSNV